MTYVLPWLPWIAVAGLALAVGGYHFFRPWLREGDDVSAAPLTTLHDGAPVTVGDWRGHWLVLDLWHST